MSNIDMFGRKVDYMRISVTDLCNLRCQYCMPEDGICNKLPHDQILRIEEILQVVRIAASEGIRKIRITGGEPLIRKGVLDLIREIKATPGIEEIGMTTNGVLLEKYAKDLKAAGLFRINISLDTLDDDKYRQMTRGGDLGPVIDGIKAAAEAGLSPIKINTVLIGGFNNDEVDGFMAFAKQNGIQWRVIELMPIGEVSQWSSDHFVSGKDLFDSHPDLELVESKNYRRVKIYYNNKLDMEIGLIDSLSGKFCDACNRLRLTADGKIKPCLHSDIEYDIRPHLEDFQTLKDIFKSCVLNKPKEHHLTEEDNIPVQRNMNKIGG